MVETHLKNMKNYFKLVYFRLAARDTIAESELMQRNFTLKNCVQPCTLYVNVMHCNNCTCCTGIWCWECINFTIKLRLVSMLWSIQMRLWHDDNWVLRIEGKRLLRYNMVQQRVNVSQSIIGRLWIRFLDVGNITNWPHSGRPQSTTQREDRYLTNWTLRQRRVTAR